MEFLYFLEGLRNPVLDLIFGTITYLGDEIAFLVLALTFFWCVDKRRGYYLLCVGFFGVVMNQVLKFCFRIPRPWVLDPNFKAVESAVPAASGYSFPSGHTQNATGTLGGIARSSRSAKKTVVRIVSIAAILLVAFSRMYLGVHTPLDVGVSLLIGTVMVFLLYPLFEYANKNEKVYFFIFAGVSVIAVGFLVFVLTFSNLVELDGEHLKSGIKNACTILGAALGVLVSYPIEYKLIRFKEKAPLLWQVVKLVLGLACVLLVKEGLKILFGGDAEPYALRAVRYFAVVTFSICVYPLLFSRLEGLWNKNR